MLNSSSARKAKVQVFGKSLSKRKPAISCVNPEVKRWLDSVIIPILLDKFRREIAKEQAA